MVFGNKVTWTYVSDEHDEISVSMGVDLANLKPDKIKDLKVYMQGRR